MCISISWQERLKGKALMLYSIHLLWGHVTCLHYRTDSATAQKSFPSSVNNQSIMGKSKSAKRKRNTQIDRPQKILKTSNLTPPPDGTALEPQHLRTVVSDEELEITIQTLTTLAEYPNLTKSKACKDLRVAVYDFRQACTTGLSTAGRRLSRPLLLSWNDARKTNWIAR